MKGYCFTSGRIFTFLIIFVSLWLIIGNNNRAYGVDCQITFQARDLNNFNPQNTLAHVTFTLETITGAFVDSCGPTDASGQCTISVSFTPSGTGRVSCLRNDDGTGMGVTPVYRFDASYSGPGPGYHNITDHSLLADDSTNTPFAEVKLLSKVTTPSRCFIKTDKLAYDLGEDVRVWGKAVDEIDPNNPNLLSNQEIVVAVYKPLYTPGASSDKYYCITTDANGEFGQSGILVFPHSVFGQTIGDWTVAISKKGISCSASGLPLPNCLAVFTVAEDISLSTCQNVGFKQLNPKRCACELGSRHELASQPPIVVAAPGCPLGGCIYESPFAPQDADPDPTVVKLRAVTGTWTAIGCIPNNAQGFIKIMLQFIVGLGGGIAFLFLLRGAILVLTSQGDPEKLAQGKDWITSAIFGLLFIAFATVIISIIGVDILKIPGFKR